MTPLELEDALRMLTLHVLAKDPANPIALHCMDRLAAHRVEQDDDAPDEAAWDEESESNADAQFADAEALASAGFGTDEDYFHGERE